MVTGVLKTKEKFREKRPEYEKSQAIKDAENKLKNWESQQPGPYESKYEKEIRTLLDEILNREDFSYNLANDPLYNQYRDLYVSNGKKAMKDTIGNASSLTGGYLNSYAVTAGNQAYDEYLNDLNYVALDLRDRAYEQYSDEGDKLIEDVAVLRDLDGDDYEKYLAELERYYKEGNYLLERLTEMSDSEFESFLASVDAWESDRDYSFKQYQDQKDREEFETQMAFKQYQDNKDREEFNKQMAFKEAEAERDQNNKDREYKLAKQKVATSSSRSRSGSSKSKNATSGYPKTYGEFCLRTGYSGIMTYAEYKASERAKDAYDTYQDYLEAMYVKFT